MNEINLIRANEKRKAHDPDLSKIEDLDLKFYILGLIITDGNIDKTNSKITLSLTNQKIIEKIYPYFCDINKRKIYKYKPKNKNAQMSYTIINTNKNSILWLNQEGVFPKKTFSISFPFINNQYVSSLIRGVFDGDGCIYVIKEHKNKKYYAISITTASLLFATSLQNILLNYRIQSRINIDSRRKNNKHKTYYLKIQKQDCVQWFYQLIYNNSDWFIEYKKNKFPISLI